MAFSPTFLDELRQRLPPSQVIARRVRLIRRGREQIGLCPFHNEKTPSFTVNDDKGFFHCFGCGAHGDVIGFAMRAEGLEFREAIERLAREAGLPLPVESPAEQARAEQARTLLDATEAACAWFESQLHGGSGREALDYLHGRGLETETIARFRLGYAPSGRGLLKQALLARGFTEDLLVEAGLLTRPDDGRESFDFFRGRVIFPIADARGRVVAFGGRILGAGEPKYLNSRDTPLFDKGRMLYALDKARPAVREGAELIVVEGYMDVIALHAAGFAGAVAPLGTALTEAQIEALWRLAPEPVLCFDGDAAGMRAAERAVGRVLPMLVAGRSLRFVALPDGDDPDSLVRGRGADAFTAALAKARPLVDIVWDSMLAGLPINTPERRADIDRKWKEIIRTIADRQVQDHYFQKFREWTRDAFAPTGGRRLQPRRPAAASTGGLRSHGDVGVLLRSQGEVLVATLINHPELAIEELEPLAELELGDSGLDSLLRGLLAKCQDGLDLDSETLKSHLKRLGSGEAVDRLLRPNIYHFWPFARPEAAVDEARRGLKHILGLLQQRRIAGEVSVATRDFARNMTEAAWLRLEGMQKPSDDVDTDEGAEEASVRAARPR